ncbi:MAG: glycoside hydrolase family 95 protein, partial [Clostridiaceae bacterium]|nr:glycoside hydrolase family 95 protein [Clostridiaceae bacterium]
LLGAMIFGSSPVEHIQLNEDSVWYGNFIHRNNPDAMKNLPKIRELILAGRIPEAEKLMTYALSGTPESQRPYQSLGDLYLSQEFAGEEVSNYKRSLSLDDAIHTVEYSIGDVEYRCESFASSEDDVLVFHFASSRPGSISMSARMTRNRFYNCSLGLSDDTIYLDGNLGGDGLDFAIMAKAVLIGGSCQVIGDNLIIEEADELTLILNAGTHFRFNDLESELAMTLAEVSSYSWEELKARHINSHRHLYDRVKFELQDTEQFDNIPTNVRLARSAEGDVDIGISKLYFDYGRYLLISSSREGSLPANLQGIWNKDMMPAWDSKYTININTEMNYWPAEICNLSECHLPLFEHLKKMVPNGRETAAVMYGCRGFVAHHNTDIWGDTAVQDVYIPASYWVMGAAWLCTHIWTHYEFTQDEVFLREYYPLMMEAAEFFLDFLIEDQGYLITCPSVSPENIYTLPDGSECAVTAGSTMDNQILRDLFTQCVQAAEVLGHEDENISAIKDAADKLIPTRIGSDGRIMEWREEYPEAEPGHRHISHLYGLHPSSQITMTDTPELAQAARLTLAKRLENGGGHTGWSRAWIMNFYSKLWDGNEAYHHFEQLITQSTLPNMFDNHPPFQIDGNFGATAALAEMLVQSNGTRIVFLPALPDKWPSGKISGLRVRGNAVIDIEWAEHRLRFCKIRACSDFKTEVAYNGHRTAISLNAGQSIEFDRTLEEF